MNYLQQLWSVKELRVIFYLILNGTASYVALQLKELPELALIAGGAVNYLAYVAITRATKDGYQEK